MVEVYTEDYPYYLIKPYIYAEINEYSIYFTVRKKGKITTILKNNFKKSNKKHKKLVENDQKTGQK